MIRLDTLRTTKQVAEQWQCSEQHVNRLRRAGKLPAIAIGGTYRYHPADLQKYLTAQRTNAA